MPNTDQGVTLDSYALIPRVLIFLRRGNSVLLIKGAPTKRLWANKYNGVGGHVERGEEVLSAARRELLEETGLTTDIWLCGTVVVDTNENIGIGIYVFTGEFSEGELKPSSEGLLEWISYEELQHFPLVEDVQVFLWRILKMHRGDVPFAAQSFYENERLVVCFRN